MLVLLFWGRGGSRGFWFRVFFFVLCLGLLRVDFFGFGVFVCKLGIMSAGLFLLEFSRRKFRIEVGGGVWEIFCLGFFFSFFLE